jgi:hypothetical protein
MDPASTHGLRIGIDGGTSVSALLRRVPDVASSGA